MGALAQSRNKTHRVSEVQYPIESAQKFAVQLAPKRAQLNVAELKDHREKRWLRLRLHLHPLVRSKDPEVRH